tara:strand:+ start:231 stop:440 length:210 start_codon:yes stop_codon:yes gene_type:complete
MADRTLKSIWEIAKRIRPSMLDELGLISALRQEVRQFGERAALNCGLTMASDIPALNDLINRALFRLTQ